MVFAGFASATTLLCLHCFVSITFDGFHTLGDGLRRTSGLEAAPGTIPRWCPSEFSLLGFSMFQTQSSLGTCIASNDDTREIWRPAGAAKSNRCPKHSSQFSQIKSFPIAKWPVHASVPARVNSRLASKLESLRSTKYTGIKRRKRKVLLLRENMWSGVAVTKNKVTQEIRVQSRWSSDPKDLLGMYSYFSLRFLASKGPPA